MQWRPGHLGAGFQSGNPKPERQNSQHHRRIIGPPGCKPNRRPQPEILHLFSGERSSVRSGRRQINQSFRGYSNECHRFSNGDYVSERDSVSNAAGKPQVIENSGFPAALQLHVKFLPDNHLLHYLRHHITNGPIGADTVTYKRCRNVKQWRVN